MSEIQLSGSTLMVLKYLLQNARDGRCGADITRATKIGPGTVYPILKRLKVAGWVIDWKEDAKPSVVKRPQRKLYRLTGDAQIKVHQIFRDFYVGS